MYKFNVKATQKGIKLIGTLIIVLVVFYSCSKDSNDPNLNSEGTMLKYILSHGKIVETFYYNSNGKIEKDSRSDSYEQYIYDSTGLLVKRDCYELLNGQFTLTYFYEYTYDLVGKLMDCKIYDSQSKGTGGRGIYSYEYKGDRITKMRIHSFTDTTTLTLYLYQYDTQGNIINKKYFSRSEGSDLKLQWEETYKFDDKNNPIKTCNDVGWPGNATNTNNIIEIDYTVYFEIPPGLDKYQTEYKSYEYNSQAYPIKELYGDAEHEYRYY